MDFRFDERVRDADRAQLLRLVRECPPGVLHEVADALSDRLKEEAAKAEEAAADEGCPIGPTLHDASVNAALACGWARKAAKLGWAKEG